jgi:hypothetical protein
MIHKPVESILQLLSSQSRVKSRIEYIHSFTEGSIQLESKDCLNFCNFCIVSRIFNDLSLIDRLRLCHSRSIEDYQGSK